MATIEAPAQKKPPPTTHGDKDTRQQGKLARILLTPTMLVLLIVIGYPILAGTYQSLFSQSQGVDESGFVVQGDQFVGLDNYTAIFTGAAGERFWNAFYNTTYFTVVTVTLEVILGIAMALIMNRAFRAKGIIRASILIPWAIPTVVSALLWRWIFDANGIANDLLGTQVLWSTDGAQAQWAIIIADVWKTSPFIGLLVLAGLQVIPAEVYEAAKVDGASALRQFWSITLPLVKPALLVAVLFRILDGLRMFDLPFVLVGQGKPSVETVSILAFLENSNVRFGAAAAYAVLLFLYIVVVAYAFVRLLGADLIGDAKQKTPKPAGGRRRLRTVAKGDMP
ncbi:sugar ABC transporter permease [Pseudonocardia petroleophila]|uniref:Sugar ABC transporter permease n=1 Tax=Pseudonocardia petroleophila TaxID=37331 RepID=A0A7G7MLE9_9PSEU|nr:sugar ABC transporter permease [Pseudonocardia petroleophila]QNG53610.1 sugar ABC transporter permease [Pseudonocardia petroleophila]